MSTSVVAEAQPFPQNTVHFCVHSAADAGALSRVIEYFALNNLLPDTVRSRRFVDGELVIDIKIKGLDDHRVAVITNKLRANVLVFSVAVEVVAIGLDLEDFHRARGAAA